MPVNWSSALRAELAKRAAAWGTVSAAPSYLSLGANPACLFEPYDNGARHGNFLDASYQTICLNHIWLARTQKPHQKSNALPCEKRSTARELDSCNSSDALLMNCFCYPEAAEQIFATLLPSLTFTPPEFGVKGEVALVGGKSDATEIDMRISSAIFEAKLTERDFTSRPKSYVERYARFGSIFDCAALPQTVDQYLGYQLIRNVLAAEQYGWMFYLICDAHRPDLLREWWMVHSAILDHRLSARCGFLLWQEVARASPPDLAVFLAQKYGIGNVLGDALAL